jgi:hypothetical protein
VALFNLLRHPRHRPLNWPRRFSRKARMPSFWSSVAKRK